MKNFEEIQAKWQNQANKQAPNDGAAKIIEKINHLKNGQRITNIILGITVAILIAFFFYVKAYLVIKASLALGLMIMSIVVRILIEIFNLNRLKQIKYDLSFDLFKQEMITYYKTRLKTHYYLTPVILAIYIVGFVILMPFFKQGLDRGFYLYIQISAVIVFVLGTYLIFKEVKKELSILRSLIK